MGHNRKIYNEAARNYNSQCKNEHVNKRVGHILNIAGRKFFLLFIANFLANHPSLLNIVLDCFVDISSNFIFAHSQGHTELKQIFHDGPKLLKERVF